MSIYNGNLGDSKRLHVDLYKCQTDSGIDCVNEIPSKDLVVKAYAYEKTVNIKDFHTPITSTHK